MLTRSLALFVIMLTLCRPGMGQPQRMMPEEQQGQFVYITAVTYPDTGADRTRIDVRYRIDRNFFVAVRTTDPAAGGPFLRAGEILIELFDSSNTSASRKIDRVSVPDTQAERDPGEALWYEGMASFSVKQGSYRVFFEATDRQSDRRYVHHGQGLMVRAISPVQDGLTLFPLGTIAPVTDLRTATIVPDNFGDDVLFAAAREYLMAVMLPNDTTRTVTIDHRIGVLEREGHPGPALAADSGRVLTVLTGYALRPVETTGTVAYAFVPRPGSRIGFIALPIATDKLPLRTYGLDIHARAGTNEAHLKRTFRNVWPSMPRSLRDVDGAIEALKLITSEQTRDSLASGDFAERRDALEAFWSKRDPTPGTITNEAMTEFYRRVDHARSTFSTLQEPDGLRSDRGKVYILNGQPSRVERALDPARGYTEVWSYDRTKRTFTFVDERRNGTYKLAGAQR